MYTRERANSDPTTPGKVGEVGVRLAVRDGKLSQTLCNPYPQTPIFTRAKSGTPLMGGGERTGYSYGIHLSIASFAIYCDRVAYT